MHDEPPLPTLDADATALLDALRADETPAAQDLDRVWERVETPVRDTARPAIAVGPERDASGRSWTPLVAAAVAAAAVLVGLWVVRGRNATPAGAGTREQAAAYDAAGATTDDAVAAEGTEGDTGSQVRPVPESTPEDPEPETSSAPPADATDSPEPPVEAPTETGPTDRPDREPAPEPEADAGEPEPERPSDYGLIKRAQKALNDGRPRDALELFDEHARLYPRSQLAPEREYDRYRTRCRLGQAQKARDLADAYLAKHPESEYAAKMRGQCVQRPKGDQ